VEYLVVDTQGRILAALQSLGEVAREVGRIQRDSQTSGRVTVVRHDEDYGDVMSVDSFVTASPLPPLRDFSR
jgi:hypothetical protein